MALTCQLYSRWHSCQRLHPCPHVAERDQPAKASPVDWGGHDCLADARSILSGELRRVDDYQVCHQHWSLC
jgi:hypothetical protein